MSGVIVASADELGDLPLGVEVPGRDLEVALVRVGDEVFAVRDECSHGHVRLSEGDVDTDDLSIECYLHGSMFSLRTGEALNLPATQPVPVYPCAIEDDQIVVDIDNPISTHPDPARAGHANQED
ncbi:non-heme iron oxygenase ferredoxin subunit [Brooklawnia cerclae]|uniref:3-phenylpropionate/trans-cinnamate dioxygenase ferredoxin subunit n=1 Tax=Brooklawnia cerclae TaxID=349934 RepID=A0ABX0SGF7_9ACTN|nr:non-heme iron oxygenase ferredoxin subunit [Brooklawnia cerclae]NIH57468.1 3-phenylpropionate/trans-cinnamate dioxygenase ferredoxin subunit [Brooklawnia cerclae]